MSTLDALVTCLAGVLLLAAAVALALGVARLRTPASRRYLSDRRRRVTVGWQQIGVGLVLALGAVMVLFVGSNLASWMVPIPTDPAATGQPLAPTAGPTARAAAETVAAVTLIAGLTPTSSPSPIASATITPTPGPTGQPTLPFDRITEPPDANVTPPPNAVIANLRVGTINDCSQQDGVSQVFDTRARTLYALFDYNNWLPGARWTYVWRRDGTILFVNTLLWDGTTGGCGFAEYDNAGDAWRPGAYDIQVFIGEAWLDTAFVTINETGARPTETPSP